MLRRTYLHRTFALTLMATLACSGLYATGTAEAAKGSTASGPTRRAQDKDGKVEEIDLLSKGNVVIKATYYHGSEGKTTVPIILVHGEDGKRTDLDSLAKALQKDGHAVLAPDLRGHGDSLTVQGQERKLDAKRFRPADFADMAYDIEACKKYFKELNNAEKCNIENLIIIGAGKLGSVLSLAYAAEDWRVAPFGSYKQGQDVKAVIMFSPVMREKGIQLNGYLRDASITREMSMFLIVNVNDATAKREADRLEDGLNRASQLKDDKERIVRLNVPTSLEGAGILEVKEAPEILRQIGVFIKRRVVDKKHEWTKRERQ